MHSPARNSGLKNLLRLLALLLVVSVLMVWWRHRSELPPKIAPTKQLPAALTTMPTNPFARQVFPASLATGLQPNYADFKERPFPMAYESAKVQWTLADGKDTNIIRQLAHNHLEYARMVEENPRIFRRQLVYLKETAAAVFEQAKLTGAPVRQLTLPGADGQELQFEIVQSTGGGSSRLGMFYGHLVGNVDSLVSLAFQDGREAFTVLAPKENIFMVGEPRESGQVLVKVIDPNTYGTGLQDVIDTVKPSPANK